MRSPAGWYQVGTSLIVTEEDSVKLTRRTLLRLAAGAAVLSILSISLSGHGASSQTARTIKIVDPYASGGSTDILARLLAEQIRRAQGIAIVVENRPGAA